jgi:hypothetical protein
MWLTISRALSLLVAGGYVAVTAAYLPPANLLRLCYLIFPLVLIWFPEELGSFTGYVGRGGWIDKETPPILVSIMGWLLLLGLPVLMYFMLNRGPIR